MVCSDVRRHVCSAGNMFFATVDPIACVKTQEIVCRLISGKTVSEMEKQSSNDHVMQCPACLAFAQVRANSKQNINALNDFLETLHKL